MVKETSKAGVGLEQEVSIPSRGSGKGDLIFGDAGNDILNVSIPSRGSGKGDTFMLLWPQTVV